MRLDEVCERIAAGIVALSADDWQLHTSVTEAWNESDIPLDPAYGAENTAHLQFSVLPRGSPNANKDRDAPGGHLSCASRIDVAFSYRIRPTEQKTDTRASMNAALQLIRCVNDEALWGSEDDVLVQIVERWRPTFLFEGHYLLITIGFVITHEEEL